MSRTRQLIQGAAFVALCFFTLSASAHTQYSARGSHAEAAAACAAQFGSCTFTGSLLNLGSTEDYLWWQGSTNHPIYISLESNSWWPAGTTDPEDYDENGCFQFQGNPICSDDPNYVDADGYSGEGCDQNNVCPGDPGWADAEGYDEDGFDENGLDRGGKTAAEGGGYFGALGSGGSAPHYIDPPIPVDPQNGNNRDGNNILQCPFAYPITATQTLLPSVVQDGLAGCANECVYQPQSTFFDFDTQQEVVQLVPTGFACTTEPAMSVIEVSLYTPPPMGEEPPDPYDNLNSCYVNGAYMFCDSIQDPDPPECFVYVAGWIGAPVTCQDANVDPNYQTCGVFNGVYHCLDSNTNCESFNGAIKCIDDLGNIIADTSPDHIINGGNGDGDETNDVFADSTDVINNGQAVQERQVESLNAREFARQIASELAPSFSSLGNQIGNINLDLGYLDDGDEGDGAAGLNNLLGRIGGVGTDGELTFDGSIADSLKNRVESILPNGGACSNFQYDLLPSKGMVINLDTCQLTTVRIVAEWFLYAATVIALFNIVIRQRQEI